MKHTVITKYQIKPCLLDNRNNNSKIIILLFNAFFGLTSDAHLTAGPYGSKRHKLIRFEYETIYYSFIVISGMDFKVIILYMIGVSGEYYMLETAVDMK